MKLSPTGLGGDFCGIRPRISDSLAGSPVAEREVQVQEKRPESQNLRQRNLAGVHAGLCRRRQQRLPNPLPQTHPRPTRTFLQQGELRLADLRANWSNSAIRGHDAYSQQFYLFSSADDGTAQGNK